MNTQGTEHQDCDLLIETCAVLLPDLTVAENHAIAIQGQRIAAIGPASELRRTFSPCGVLDGTDKLAIPGLIDAHTHTAQHLLRGAVIDERPIVWQRILIPFESKLADEDIYHSARLACLQMARRRHHDLRGCGRAGGRGDHPRGGRERHARHHLAFHC